MRSKLKKLHFLSLPAMLIGGLLVAGQASADSRYRDQVYADSQGNLIIYSASGYKRIVIGEGHLAKELGAYTSGPDVVYLDEDNGGRRFRDCPAALLKGRSYMYGLPDHVVPEPSRDYCD